MTECRAPVDKLGGVRQEQSFGPLNLMATAAAPALPADGFARPAIGFIISLLAVWCTSTFAVAESKGIPPLKDLNVLVILIDTLGSRHISPHDATLNHTPHLQGLADNSVVFDRMQAAAPWTKPSLSSIITGKLPSRHGVRSMTSVLAESELTMAEWFKERGYATRGIVSHTLVTERHGFSQGYDRYNIVPFKGNIHRVVSSHLVSDEGIEFLDERKADDRFFLFLHYFDPHYDYFHHEDFNLTAGYKGQLEPFMPFRKLRSLIPKYTKEDVEYLVNLYREEIAYTDHHIGRVLEKLKSSSFAKNTLIVFSADHGEEFIEHGGIGHTRTLYDELIHVPLMFSLPGKLAPRRIATPVSHVDIFPTLANLDPAADDLAGVDGISLLPALEGDEPPVRPIISEVDYRSSGIRASIIAATHGPWKVIHDKLEDTWELYNRDDDPLEKNNLPPSAFSEFERYKSLILDYKNTVQTTKSKGPEITHTKEDIKELRSLGYL